MYELFSKFLFLSKTDIGSSTAASDCKFPKMVLTSCQLNDAVRLSNQRTNTSMLRGIDCMAAVVHAYRPIMT